MHPQDAGFNLPPAFSVVKGRKGKGDWILQYHGFAVKLVELGEATAFIVKNDDRIYPPEKGFEGGKMTKNFINDAMNHGGVSEEIKKKYKLS